MWLFLTVRWVGLQSVIVVFPDQTYLHFGNDMKYHMTYNIRQKACIYILKSCNIRYILPHNNKMIVYTRNDVEYSLLLLNFNIMLIYGV